MEPFPTKLEDFWDEMDCCVLLPKIEKKKNARKASDGKFAQPSLIMEGKHCRSGALNAKFPRLGRISFRN